ncbi:hypothetical protein EYF80_002249 [Liparis tanakae]|uniref:Uncharacterized protein n=1 Tax=Liparis tanakae TaxID=230148 RepID=A0A4Z2JE65_9TELE|nr:hypothetical protein EYF80_002249 [Liparis tanakae]
MEESTVMFYFKVENVRLPGEVEQGSWPLKAHEVVSQVKGRMCIFPVRLSLTEATIRQVPQRMTCRSAHLCSCDLPFLTLKTPFSRSREHDLQEANAQAGCFCPCSESMEVQGHREAALPPPN